MLHWTAASVALAGVLAAAGSAPAGAEPESDAVLFALCREAMQQLAAEQNSRPDLGLVSVALSCERSDGTHVDPDLWLPPAPARPAPTPVPAPGHPACITGLGRPVVGTALTAVRATSSTGEAITYDYQRLGGYTVNSASGTADLEFGPGDLAPGATYRWRARVDDFAEPAGVEGVYRGGDYDEAGWSPWCEFSVSASAPTSAGPRPL